MKALLILVLLGISGCYTDTYIPDTMLHNAECRCKGKKITQISVRAAWNIFNRGTVKSFYKFHCEGGLETGWWLYSGSMGPLSGSPWYDENCNNPTEVPDVDHQ